MPTLTDKFNIVECHGVFTVEQVLKVLEQFPVEFFLVDENIDSRISFEKQKRGAMDVYHDARVIDLYPPEGKRLSNAVVTDKDFPFKPDNIMDDQLGLRCCYHPAPSTFDIRSKDDIDSMEIDIHKFSKAKRYY